MCSKGYDFSVCLTVSQVDLSSFLSTTFYDNNRVRERDFVSIWFSPGLKISSRTRKKREMYIQYRKKCEPFFSLLFRHYWRDFDTKYTGTRISQRKKGETKIHIYIRCGSLDRTVLSLPLLFEPQEQEDRHSRHRHTKSMRKRGIEVCVCVLSRKSVGECRRRDTPNCSLFEFDRGKVGGNSLFSPFRVGVCVWLVLVSMVSLLSWRRFFYFDEDENMRRKRGNSLSVRLEPRTKEKSMKLLRLRTHLKLCSPSTQRYYPQRLPPDSLLPCRILFLFSSSNRNLSEMCSNGQWREDEWLKEIEKSEWGRKASEE